MSRVFIFIAFGLAVVMTGISLFSHYWWGVGFGLFIMIGTAMTYLS